MLKFRHKAPQPTSLQTMANLILQSLLKLFLRSTHPHPLQNLLVRLTYPIITLQKLRSAPCTGSYVDQSPFYGLSSHSFLMSTTADLTFRRHGRTHKKGYHCNIGGCCQAFSYAKDLHRHRTAKHGIGHKVYCTVHDCKWSQKGFSRLDIRQRHLRNVHGTN